MRTVVVRSAWVAVPFLLVAACKMDAILSSEGSAATPECGGPDQPACVDRIACTEDSECNGGVCAGDGKCSNIAGMNGIKDGDETDVDCGGSQSPKCDDGKTCRANENCTGGYCKAGICAVARGDDGVKNGDETDVDCGGTKTGAPRCVAGKACVADDDCANKACSYKHVCVERPSCKVHFGGDTCGPGEHDDPTNQNESCCRSIEMPMPSKPVLLDKYTVTAGRMRVFLESINGNVRDFVTKNPPPGWDPVWNDYVPNGWDVDSNEAMKGGFKGIHSSVWHQLGSTALTDRIGRDGRPFQYGCYIAGYGTHTYWMPDNVQTDVLKDIPHKYPKEILDTKALNCVTSLMLRAFCHWDWPGSSLPTYLEYRFAYDGGDRNGHYYPWGNAPAPIGYRTLKDEVQWDANGKPVTFVPYGAEGRGTDFTVANWGQNYTYPQNTAYPDMTPHIAAPGRFPKGNGPFGHSDIGGNVFDLTSTMTGENGMHPDDREVAWGRNGSYGGHDLPFAEYDKPWLAVTMRKYGFAGGRCAKPK